MVWIETHTGDGILNDAIIERIYSESPANLNKSFEIYAQVNGKDWLIYAANIPSSITSKAKDKRITDELRFKIDDIEERILKRIMLSILDAKTINNNQVISLRGKFSESDFLKDD